MVKQISDALPGAKVMLIQQVIKARWRPWSILKNFHLVYDNIDIYDLKQEKQADFRREFLGFILQSFRLGPYLMVFENVLLSPTLTNKSKRPKRAMVEDN